TPTGPRGTIASNLPVPLEGVALIYKDQCYNIPADKKYLAPGESWTIDNLFNRPNEAPTLQSWGRDRTTLRPDLIFPPGRKEQGPPPPEMASSNQILKAALFRAEVAAFERENSGLRLLDQTWRVRSQFEVNPGRDKKYRSEIVLLA